MRQNFTATVINCKGDKITGIFRLWLQSKQWFKAKPGQFVMLESFSADKIWRRPFSVYAQGGSFVIKFKVRGENTEYYSKRRPGDQISIIGPLGKPIFIDPKYKKVILAAGGIGMAGLMLLASELRYSPIKVTFLYGAKNRREITDVDLLKHYGCKVKVVVEDEGQGQVTDLLASELEAGLYDSDSQIIACGPNAMLEKVAGLALRHGIPSQVVMETLMACGYGSCKGCAISKKNSEKYFHLCQDGPALPGDMVDWEKLRRPSVIVSSERRQPVEEIKMETVLVGQYGRKLVLPSPIIIESGCLDASAVTDGPVDLTGVGAIKSKGITLKPREGNPPPRICEIPSGMLNSIGLENVGLEKFIEEQLPKLKSLGVEVIVNFSGFTINEFVIMAKALYQAGVRIFDLNLSCPNTEKGDQIFSASSDDTFEVTRQVRRVAPKAFIFVKLSPMPSNIVEVAQAAKTGGADALTLLNTYLGMEIDLESRRPAIGNVYGGMSGPAVRPMALRLVHLICQQVNLPVVASTGITCGADAAKYMIAGAQAVGIGTGLLSNPSVGAETFCGLREIVANYGMTDVKELVGSLIL